MLRDWTSKTDKNATPYIIKLTFPKQPKDGFALKPNALEFIFDKKSTHRLEYYPTGISLYCFTQDPVTEELVEGFSSSSPPQGYDSIKHAFLQAIMTRLTPQHASILKREIAKHDQRFQPPNSSREHGLS